MILRVSSQGQVTLPYALREKLNFPDHFSATLESSDRLVLEPCEKLTLDEAELRYGRHGITQEVLIEALRVLKKREKEAAQAKEEAAVAGTSAS